ncbi:hypothetical protein VTP01DRAFT_975 [Rhizomucor pusillus]|uniref:uncharacterized protein n=1 Tax=Rhizomucor pusillus TaxID=4840 RepID=UPI0037436129
MNGNIRRSEAQALVALYFCEAPFRVGRCGRDRGLSVQEPVPSVVSVRPLGMRLFLELQGLRRAGLISAGCFRAIKRATVDIFFRAAPLLSSLVDIWLLEDMLLHRDIPYINKAVSDTLMGLLKGNVSEQDVRSILANFTFNDRPMHYFVVRLVNNEYTTVRQSRYFRAQGSTYMTFVPGPGNSLVPSKYFIKDRPVLSSGLLGFTSQVNITLGWCDGQLKHGQIIDGVQLLEVVDHGETVRSTQDVRDDVLHLNESVNMTTFQADYNVMESDRQYRIICPMDLGRFGMSTSASRPDVELPFAAVRPWMVSFGLESVRVGIS